MATESFAQIVASEPVLSLVLRAARDTAAAQFVKLARSPTDEEPIDWHRAIKIASILASNEEETSQEAALRLASGCLLAKTEDTAVRFGAATVLERLANTLAVEMARERGLLPTFADGDRSLSAIVQSTRLDLEYGILQRDGSVLRVNQFQKNLFAALNERAWVSASASTSVGKSYAMGAWLANELAGRDSAVVVFVVPTRALIHENEQRLRKLLIHDKQLDGEVRSIPSKHESEHAHQIYVFTQERLHLWLSRAGFDRPIDLLVIDEAHKVGDGARGVLLQQALELVLSRSRETQVVFLSPSTSNPEVLLQDAPQNAQRITTQSSSVTVLQNLMWATQRPRHPKSWKLSLVRGDDSIELGTFKLPADPAPASKRLPFVAYALGHQLGGNIVYANGAALAEKYCKQLYDLVGTDEEDEFTEDRENLADLAGTVVHRKYLLVEIVKRGIAYHYGNMPLILRTEIERLFERGGIKYLVCTSTLVEGVNTACKSIFLRGPKKGAGHPMSEADFWNLAGRAGRWGREFQGNVVCVDAATPAVWGESLAPTSRKRYSISRRAVELVSQGDELLEFITAQGPRDIAMNRPDLESTAAYLGATIAMGQSLNALPWTAELRADVVREIETHLLEAIGSSGLSPETISSNPGISVFAMRLLMNRFRDSAHPPEELAPVLPSSEDAVKHYAEIFGRISQEMNHHFGSSRFLYGMALLTVNWMRGYPVARLVNNRFASLRNQNHDPNVQSEIRKTLQLVERFPRFLAPRYVACYCDVLRDHMSALGMTEQANEILDVSIRLELGVSSTTQMSLAALGLSRSTSLAVSELIAADDMREAVVLQWLAERSWATASLPRLMKDEIDRALIVFESRIRE